MSSHIEDALGNITTSNILCNLLNIEFVKIGINYHLKEINL